jgi:hypothetical protein
MLRFTALILCAGLGFAQTPADKPPAGVDDALRARVSEYFKDMVDAQFRKAEALVAEDSKDAYYNAQKPDFSEFEIFKIEYSDNFTRAKVTTKCLTTMAVAGFAGQRIKVSVLSNWKLENGQWFYFIDLNAPHPTPFGVMTHNPDQERRPKNMPTVLPTNPGFALGKITADKKVVNLKAGESASVTLTNSATGLMSISLVGSISGVEVKLDRVNLTAGERALVSLRTTDAAKSGTLSIQVDQTNEVIPIQVNIE